MKYFEMLPKSQHLRTACRHHLAWLFILCWLVLNLITPARAQDLLEAQGLRFRLIPGGSYFIGSPQNEAGRYANEPAPHRVTVKPFYLAATGHAPPLYWQDKNLNTPDEPVVGVTWHDARAFCRWSPPHRWPCKGV
jgi:formylglycine-generating enzyme required for sulfatase activity